MSFCVKINSYINTFFDPWRTNNRVGGTKTLKIIKRVGFLCKYYEYFVVPNKTRWWEKF